jgi:hypothetical protein
MPGFQSLSKNGGLRSNGVLSRQGREAAGRMISAYCALTARFAFRPPCRLMNCSVAQRGHRRTNDTPFVPVVPHFVANHSITRAVRLFLSSFAVDQELISAEISAICGVPLFLLPKASQDTRRNNRTIDQPASTTNATNCLLAAREPMTR